MQLEFYVLFTSCEGPTGRPCDQTPGLLATGMSPGPGQQPWVMEPIKPRSRNSNKGMVLKDFSHYACPNHQLLLAMGYGQQGLYLKIKILFLLKSSHDTSASAKLANSLLVTQHSLTKRNTKFILSQKTKEDVHSKNQMISLNKKKKERKKSAIQT